MALGEERQVVPLRCELQDKYLDFKWLEQKPTAPSDAKLPPLKEPLFFSWKFADGERLFVLAKEGKGFVLYVDTDGDNDLTDEQPFRCLWRDWRPYSPILKFVSVPSPSTCGSMTKPSPATLALSLSSLETGVPILAILINTDREWLFTAPSVGWEQYFGKVN
jgi:hypothetical protein